MKFIIAIVLYLLCGYNNVAQLHGDVLTWNTPETLTNLGYPNEIHWITTDDGYILQVHRITGSPTSDVIRHSLPIILGHSLCSSSYDWVGLGPSRALGLQLAENGFDVWLLNNRGNAYSTNHTTMDPNDLFDSSYWEFSWHEMGVYDLPATIDYILQHTNNQRLDLIGVSEGATQFYVMLAERPEYNRRIRAHFSYAPATFLCHLSNIPTLILAFPERFGIDTLVNQFTDSFNVVPNSALLTTLAMSCPLNAFTESFCGSVYTVFGNSNPAQQDRELLPIILSHTPSGCSSRTIVHYVQSVQTCRFGRFQETMFDDRVEYNLTNVQTPIYAYYSSYDRFVDTLDVFHLNQSLPNGFAASSENSVLGHSDFAYGTSAPSLVYNDTVNRLINLNNLN